MEDNNDLAYSMSSQYSILAGMLLKAEGIRQFSFISETMEWMLSTKVLPSYPYHANIANIYDKAA